MIDKRLPRSLNNSADSRIRGVDEMTDALNILVTGESSNGSADGSVTGDAGVVKPINGNAVSATMEDYFSDGFTKVVIGSVADDKYGFLYFFVFSENASETGVYRVNTNLNVERVFTSPYFNFPSDGFVKADVVHLNAQNVDEDERTILYFTDNVNEPRKIDVNRALTVDFTSYIERDILDFICACPRHPVQPAECFFDFDVDSNYNNFKDKSGFQFAYQTVYYSGEESAISTYSAYAIPSSYITAGNTVVPSNLVENRCVIRIPRDGYSRETQYLRILTRQHSSENWFLVDQIAPDFGDYTEYNFYNERLLTAIPEYEVSKQFDNLPKRAQAQTFSENRLFYGNYVEGFDPIPTNVTISAQYAQRGQDFVNSSIEVEPVLAYTGRGVDPANSTQIRNRVMSFKIGQPNVPDVMLEGETYRLFFTVTPKENWHIYDAKKSWHAFQPGFVQPADDPQQADGVGLYEDVNYNYDWTRHSFGQSDFSDLFTVNNNSYRSKWEPLLGEDASNGEQFNVSYGSSPTTPIIIKGQSLTFDVQLRTTQDIDAAPAKLQQGLITALYGGSLEDYFELATTPKITSSYSYDLNINHRQKIFPNTNLSSLICCAVEAGDLVTGQELAEPPVGYFIVNEAEIQFSLRPLQGYESTLDNRLIALDIDYIQNAETITVVPDVDLNNYVASGSANWDNWSGESYKLINKWVAINPANIVPYLTSPGLRAEDFPQGKYYIEDIINSQLDTPESDAKSRIRKILGRLNLLDDGKLFFTIPERFPDNQNAYATNGFSIIDGAGGPGGTPNNLSSQIPFVSDFSVNTSIVRYGRNIGYNARIMPLATADVVSLNQFGDDLTETPDILYTNEGVSQVRASISNITAYQTEINQGVFNRSFKTDSVHSFGIVYYDQRGRAGSVMPIGSVYVEGLGSRGNFDDTGQAGVNIIINHDPPQWAFKYQIVYTGNNTIDKFIQYTSAGAFIPEGENRIYVSLNYLQQSKNSYVEAFGAASPVGDNRMYQFQTGDRLRVISAYRGDDYSREFFSDTEFEVIDFVTLTDDAESNPLYVPGDDLSDSERSKVGDFVVLKNNPTLIDFSANAVRNSIDLWNNRCVVELYSTKKTQDSEDVVYYETSNVYDVVFNNFDPENPVLVHDQTNITTYNGDVFFRRVPVKIPTFINDQNEDIFPQQEVGSFEDMVKSNNDNFNSYFLESDTFNDLVRFSDVDNFGKVKSVLPNEIEVRRTSSITFGEANNYASSLSKITSFNKSIGNFKDLPNGYGSINYIHAFNEFIVCIQEGKISRIPVNRNIISDAGTNQQLVASLQVLGNQSFFSGDYGCDGHPESVVIVDNDVYFADLGGEEIIRFNRLEGGVSAISQNGMKEFFERQFRALGENPRIVGGYDPLHDEFLISMYDQTTLTSQGVLFPLQPTQAAIVDDDTGPIYEFTINPDDENYIPGAGAPTATVNYVDENTPGLDAELIGSLEISFTFINDYIPFAFAWQNTTFDNTNLVDKQFVLRASVYLPNDSYDSGMYVSMKDFLPSTDENYEWLGNTFDNEFYFNDIEKKKWVTLESFVNPVYDDGQSEVIYTGPYDSNQGSFTLEFWGVTPSAIDPGVQIYVKDISIHEVNESTAASRTAPKSATTDPFTSLESLAPSPQVAPTIPRLSAVSASRNKKRFSEISKGKDVFSSAPKRGVATDEEVIDYWVNIYTASPGSEILQPGLGTLDPSPIMYIGGFYNMLYGEATGTEGDFADVLGRIKNLCFIDCFGAGPVASNDFYKKGGVYTDRQFMRQAKTHRSVDRFVRQNPDRPTGFNRNRVFDPVFIPGAFVTERKEVDSQWSTFYNADNHENVDPYYTDGSGTYFHFGKYGTMNTTDAFSGPVKIYDARIHGGVLAMIDYMPFRDYFRYKLHSVSPKFGIESVPEDPEFLILHGFRDHGAVAGMGYTPYPGWAPCSIRTYAQWTSEIVEPFFNEFGGQEVMPVLNQFLRNPGHDEGDDLAGGVPDYNNMSDGHYEFFNQILELTESGSLPGPDTGIGQNTSLPTYGPLVYDFDCDGVWGPNDLAIWQALTTYWSSLGDDSLGPDDIEPLPANYFCPAHNAIKTLSRSFSGTNYNEGAGTPGIGGFDPFGINNPDPQPGGIWNLLQGVSTQFDEFTPSTLPISPSNRACFNWNKCLDQVPFNFVQPPGPPVSPVGAVAPYFDLPIDVATTVLTPGAVNSLYNDSGTWYSITVLYVLPDVSSNFVSGFNLEERPTDSFFPITKYWA